MTKEQQEKIAWAFEQYAFQILYDRAIKVPYIDITVEKLKTGK